MTFLLDVNLLFVLHHPLHPDFKRVNRWFPNTAGKSFATCPITQSGLMRLLVGGVRGLDSFDIWEASNALKQTVRHPGHVFWPDSPSYPDCAASFFDRLQGPRQITDAYLLGLAIYNKGKLATLDRSIRHLAGKEFSAHLEVIET
jgi:toxin-antitoxin system PIN domain toxin